jgi:hypothetical protein
LKLHSPAFEKALRRRIKQTVAASPALRREARTVRRSRKEHSLALIFRVAISIGVAALAWFVGSKTQHPATALAVVTLWMFFLLFTHTQRLLATLYGEGDLSALSLLPVTNATIFRWQFQKFVRRSGMSLLDLLCGLSAVAWWLDFPPLKWVAVPPIAALAWLTLLALGMLLAIYFPSFPYAVVSAIAPIMGLALFFAREYVGPPLLAMLDRAAPHLNAVLPIGWPVSLFQLLLPERSWLIALLLLPTAAIIWTMSYSMGRLKSTYEFHEVVVGEAPDLVPEEAAAEAARSETSSTDQPFHIGVTAIEDIIRARHFMAGPQWRERGPFEGLLWRWLTVREKALAEFVFPDGFIITNGWKGIAKTFVITMVLALVAAYVFPLSRNWMLGIGLFITGFQALGRMLDAGRAFQAIRCSGVNIPMYAVYPIGYRELGRLLMKYATVQAPALLAFTVFASVVTTAVIKQPVAMGAIIGCKLAVLVVGARAFALALSFSSNTNDTSGFRFHVFALIGLIVFGGILFLLLAGASLVWPTQWIAWMFCLAAAAESYAFFRIYGWFYNHTRFDLMAFPRQ